MYVFARVRPVPIIVGALVLLLSGTKSDAQRQSVIYREVKAPLDQQAELAMRRAYEGRFTIVPINRIEGFEPSRCTRRIVPSPQRDRNEQLQGGSIRVAFIITSHGQIVQPVILSSTNRALDPIVLGTIAAWRGTPARLNGIAVSCLEGQDFTFKSR